MHDLLDFAAALIEHEGGVVEPAQGIDALDALLPPALAGALRLSEQSRLLAKPEDGGASDGVPLVYGGDLLERMIARVTTTTPGVSAQLPQVSLPPMSVVEAAGRACWLRNGVCDVVGTRRVGAARLIVHGVLTLRGDEQRQALLSGAWSVDSKGLVPNFGALLDARQLVASPPLSASAMAALAPAVQAGFSHLSEWTSAEFISRQQQRFDRDRARMHTYFHDMREELRLRVLHGKLTPEAAAERLGAIDRDEQAKLDVLKGRFALHASVRPIGWLSVALSAAAVEVRLRRRKVERSLALEFDPLTRQLVPPPCDGCWRPTLNPNACDAALHLLCEVCAPESSGRPKCPACAASPALR
jgi:hypothetical protein